MAGRPHIFVLYIYMVAMILGGAGNGVATKIVDKTEFNDKPFHHPYFQSFAMFVAESLCIFAYLYELWDAKKKYGNYELSPDVIEAKRRGKSTKINPLKFIFPMLCDAVGSTLQLFAYLYIQVSAAQMIQGCIVLVTAFQSVLFLRKRLHRHHWTGLFFVVLGIALVGLAVMISGSDSDEDKPIVGIILMFGSILIQGSQFVIEEKFLGDYYISPLKVVGWEGIWGVLLFAILLPAFQFIPCDLDFCSNGVIEDTHLALRHLINVKTALILQIVGVLCMIAYNGFGITITKHMSATSRTTLKQTKIVIVWIFFLAYQGDGHESFKPLQLVGFLILVAGIILYNEIIVIPFLGFNKNTMKEKEKTKQRVESLLSGMSKTFDEEDEAKVIQSSHTG